MEIASLEDYQTRFEQRSLWREAYRVGVEYSGQDIVNWTEDTFKSKIKSRIEEDNADADYKPEPVDILDCDNAWVDRKGLCYQCGFQEHINLANKLDRHGIVESSTGSPSVVIESKGWLKLTSQMFIYIPPKKGRPLKMTRKQVRAVMEYFNERDELEFNFQKYDSSDFLLNHLEEMELI